ncbi:hypothetical protein U1Q18_023926 [Sarracenia purpurea var. burkii]
MEAVEIEPEVEPEAKATATTEIDVDRTRGRTPWRTVEIATALEIDENHFISDRKKKTLQIDRGTEVKDSGGDGALAGDGEKIVNVKKEDLRPSRPYCSDGCAMEIRDRSVMAERSDSDRTTQSRGSMA